MSEEDTDADGELVVLVTAGSRDEAEQLAEVLVGRHLAACVQVMPEMVSVYRWRGAVERTTEHLLIVKTARARFDELEREVRLAHSYDTPEIVALPIVAGSQPYLDWLRGSTE